MVMMNWSIPRVQPLTAPSEQQRVAVNVPSKAALLETVGAHMQSGTGYNIATLNLDHVVKLRDNPDFRTAYAAHSHITADGNPIVWLSRLAGQDMNLAPGSELIEPIALLAARHGVKVGLFGATDTSLQASAEALQRRIPDLQIVSVLAPPMGFDPAGAAAQDYIAQMKEAGVGFCFIALGAPKQEIFATHFAAMLPQAGCISIGAGLDFISGAQIRAPKWVRQLAIEWLWRLLHDWRRLSGRYMRCFAILPRLTWAALQARRDTGGMHVPR